MRVGLRVRYSMKARVKVRQIVRDEGEGKKELFAKPVILTIFTTIQHYGVGFPCMLARIWLLKQACHVVHDSLWHPLLGRTRCIPLQGCVQRALEVNLHKGGMMLAS